MKQWREKRGKPKTIPKKKDKRAYVFLGCVIGFFLMLSLVPQAVNASGLVEVFKGSQTNYLYASYALENYDLDFYVDTSWEWMPWNWMDAVGRQTMYGIYCLTNGLWLLSRLLSSATGSVVSEAYRFDLINQAADSMGENMQRLAGVSASGFSGRGFYPGFLMFVVVILGVYVAYVGLFKREVSRALGAVLRTVVTFLLTTALIIYAPICIRYINEFSSDLSAAALDLGTGVTMPGTHQGEGESVDLIRDNLFTIQVYQPWLLLQWGTTNVEEIGQDRVNRLLAANPDDAYGMTRENLVKAEIETYGNMRMTVTKVVGRFGEVIFIFFINLLISIFVILMCGLMILTQILFIVYTLFLVVSFIIAMFPECGGMLKNSLMRVFNMIMLRAGYTLMITFAFTISTMIYGVSENHAFVTIGFLQIVAFAGIFFAKGDILKMMSLQEDAGTRRMQAVGGLFAYSRMRRAAFRHERRMQRVKNGVKQLGKKNLEIAGDVFRFGGKKTGEFMDRRAASWHRQAAAERSANKARIRREHAYRAAKDTPDVSETYFYRRSDGERVGSQELYDRYFQSDRPGRSYRVSRDTPELSSAEFTTEAQRIAREKYKRPEKWAAAPTGKDIKRVYYKRRLEDKTVDAVTPDSVGAELRDRPRRYYAAGIDKVPQLGQEHAGRIYRKNDGSQVSAKQMRARYVKKEAPKETYRTAGGSPKVSGSRFMTEEYLAARKIYAYPELRVPEPPSEKVKELYYGKIGGQTVGREASKETRSVSADSPKVNGSRFMTEEYLAARKIYAYPELRVPEPSSEKVKESYYGKMGKKAITAASDSAGRGKKEKQGGDGEHR